MRFRPLNYSNKEQSYDSPNMASGTSNLTKKFFFNVKFENSNQFLTVFPISPEHMAYIIGISKTSSIRINHNPEFDPIPPGGGGSGVKKVNF